MGENSGYSCVTDALSAISLFERAWCELGKGTDDPGVKDVLIGLYDALGISPRLVAIIFEQDRVEGMMVRKVCHLDGPRTFRALHGRALFH